MKLTFVIVFAFAALSIAYGQKCDENTSCPTSKVCGANGECVEVESLKGEFTKFKKDQCTSCADRCVNDACPLGFSCTSDDWCCKDCKKE